MTEQEIASAKVSMLEVQEFQDWIRDTKNPDLKKNPEWDAAVTAVLDHVKSKVKATRQEVEGYMRAHADGIVKLRAARGDEPELPNSDSVPGSSTSRQMVFSGGNGARVESEADGTESTVKSEETRKPSYDADDEEEDFFVTQSGTYPYGTD